MKVPGLAPGKYSNIPYLGLKRRASSARMPSLSRLYTPNPVSPSLSRALSLSLSFSLSLSLPPSLGCCHLRGPAPALGEGSNRLFQTLDLYWRSPEFGVLWCRSGRLKKTAWSHSGGLGPAKTFSCKRAGCLAQKVSDSDT